MQCSVDIVVKRLVYVYLDYIVRWLFVLLFCLHYMILERLVSPNWMWSCILNATVHCGYSITGNDTRFKFSQTQLKISHARSRLKVHQPLFILAIKLNLALMSDQPWSVLTLQTWSRSTLHQALYTLFSSSTSIAHDAASLTKLNL